MDELKIFEELNNIKSKIDNDLNILRSLEYESKIKSVNLYNKQLFEKLNNQEKIIEEEKVKIENDYKVLDNNLNDLNTDLQTKNNIINELYSKLDNQNSIISEKENYIKLLEGICLNECVTIYEEYYFLINFYLRFY